MNAICCRLAPLLMLVAGCTVAPDGTMPQDRQPQSINKASATNDQTASDEILLKDYRPQSIHKVPVTDIQRSKYPIIDVHSHPYISREIRATTPDGMGDPARVEAAIRDWIKIMDDVGIEKQIILTRAVGNQFDTLCEQFSKHPDRFEVWCGFDTNNFDQPGYGPAAVAELERCVRKGAKGVGELVDKGRGFGVGKRESIAGAQGMHTDDPRLDPLFEKCAELKLPVNIHVADPIWVYEKIDTNNDGMMNAQIYRIDSRKPAKGKDDTVGFDGMIDILERTARRHPRTTIIACHLANLGHDLDRLGKLLDRCPNLYVDNSGRYAEIAATPRAAIRFFRKYQDRILFGTDMGPSAKHYRTLLRILETEDEHFYAPIFDYHWAYSGFGLDDAILKKIYRDNALRILKP